MVTPAYVIVMEEGIIGCLLNDDKTYLGIPFGHQLYGKTGKELEIIFELTEIGRGVREQLLRINGSNEVYWLIRITTDQLKYGEEEGYLNRRVECYLNKAKNGHI